eukprot:TRINITY_DN2776_c0_g1_i1.p1 TRINITY_DN2776_c0_g1~~TRINITY_DN2776_c0_g1_i1.p1  ORF type:complete len:176 (-),score=23.00 TRINITY_DN2776_c0_g1_i1:73-600(-)
MTARSIIKFEHRGEKYDLTANTNCDSLSFEIQTPYKIDGQTRNWTLNYKIEDNRLYTTLSYLNDDSSEAKILGLNLSNTETTHYVITKENEWSEKEGSFVWSVIDFDAYKGTKCLFQHHTATLLDPNETVDYYWFLSFQDPNSAPTFIRTTSLSVLPKNSELEFVDISLPDCVIL